MSSIALHTHFKERDYTIIKNSIIRDVSIKPTSRILLMFLLSCDPDKFSINTRSLSASIGVGNSAITSASKELQENNYLVIQKHNTGLVSWNVFECKDQCRQYLEPDLENPDMENPDMDNQDALRRTNLKEEPSVKEEPNKHSVQQAELKTSKCVEMAFEMMWSQYHKKEKKVAAKRAFTKITSKLKTDEEIKGVTAHILNFNMYAINQLNKTKGKQYFGFNKKLLSTVLNERQYEDFSASEIYQLMAAG